MPEETKKIAELVNKLQDLEVAKLKPKDQSEYKFWNTQPVPKVDEKIGEGMNCEIESLGHLTETPYALPATFEWSEVDLKSAGDLEELYGLLKDNYSEDPTNSLRLEYSKEMIKWALLPPAYMKGFHLGVRVSANKKLIAFIAGTPCLARIYNKSQESVEINFLCVHKKLRSKRLAPVLIKEITRRCVILSNRVLTFAIYTASVYLPKPISTAMYFHRPLNIKMLVESGFSDLNKNMTLARAIKLFKLPTVVNLEGFRAAGKEDLSEMYDLYMDYMKQFDFQIVFNQEKFNHYLSPLANCVHTFVHEDRESKKILGFVSYYQAKNVILNNPKVDCLNVGYMWYCAAQNDDHLKNMIENLLISAKNNDIHVLNCMEILKFGSLFNDLKFKSSMGSLNFYLYNWKCPEVANSKQGFIVI